MNWNKSFWHGSAFDKMCAKHKNDTEFLAKSTPVDSERATVWDWSEKFVKISSHIDINTMAKSVNDWCMIITKLEN